MQHCKDIDRLDMSQEETDEYTDLYIENYMSSKGKNYNKTSYNREWEDYANYYHYEDWRRNYDI
jgi:hypothetical protein